ncbi:MAG: aminopeptidase P family protein [Intestinimonas sp.]|jgi:Xaa-Pro aminopeptidase|nr:aminopeptidase P family protein [Intestinimonas sp.]
MNHLREIAVKLPDYDLDAMLITSKPGEFYAVGFHGEGIALVTAHENFYFTDSRYIEAAQAAVTDAQVSMPQPGTNYHKMVQSILNRCGIKTLGFEENYMTVDEFNRYRDALSADLIPAGKLLTGLRACKDEEEITRMTQAQRIAERALDEILAFIRPGMTEKEIAAKLTYDMLRFGAEKMSFDPIVVSGPNGSLPHGVPGARRVEKGDFITMDFGCKFGGYCSDMTRTVAVGDPSAEMRKVYGIVLEAQLAGIAAAKAGVPGCDVDAAARKIIADAGYGPYFGHSFGHSVGIEIHESPNASPRCTTPLPAGVAVSAEPGIYLPGRFGVRIEDVVVLHEGGCINLTKAPKNLIIL